MPDQLDIEALQFLNSNQKTGMKSQKAFSDIQIDLGGKRIKTKITDRSRQSTTKTYISDEPERFIQYLKPLKDKLVTPQGAREAIKKLWAKDKSLDHLLNAKGAIVPSGVEVRELNALLNTPQVKRWFKGYKAIAKKINLSVKTLEKEVKRGNVSKEKVDSLLTKLENFIAKQEALPPKKRKSARLALRVGETRGIFNKEADGFLKGKKVKGKLTFVKIFKKKVPRYFDPKTGLFIKVPEK